MTDDTRPAPPGQTVERRCGGSCKQAHCHACGNTGTYAEGICGPCYALGNRFDTKPARGVHRNSYTIDDAAPGVGPRPDRNAYILRNGKPLGLIPDGLTVTARRIESMGIPTEHAEALVQVIHQRELNTRLEAAAAADHRRPAQSPDDLRAVKIPPMIALDGIAARIPPQGLILMYGPAEGGKTSLFLTFARHLPGNPVIGWVDFEGRNEGRIAESQRVGGYPDIWRVHHLDQLPDTEERAGGFDYLIIDGLQWALSQHGAGNENSADAVGGFFGWLRKWSDHIPVFVGHHAPRPTAEDPERHKRPRGSGHIDAAVDLMVYCLPHPEHPRRMMAMTGPNQKGRGRVYQGRTWQLEYSVNTDGMPHGWQPRLSLGGSSPDIPDLTEHDPIEVKLEQLLADRTAYGLRLSLRRMMDTIEGSRRVVRRVADRGVAEGVLEHHPPDPEDTPGRLVYETWTIVEPEGEGGGLV